MKNFVDMMKQAKQMQAQLELAQKEIERLVLEGTSKNGLVKLKMDGKHLVKELSIDPTLLTPDQSKNLETLIIDAVNHAVNNIEKASKERMKNLASGLTLPPDLTNLN